jgi:hypothetical protein
MICWRTVAHRVDSVSAQVFYAFWQRARNAPTLWPEPFGVAKPVTNPAELSLDALNAEILR